ncbi:hypothetical protein PILCRDRAFT_819452 [Piloderma croceum F 1598]|uniref:Uncharacterized protein n=1 Tax=Piloderma croceum (strain F 1598) TaxID=765440 RepID=A0A0C3FFG3_PILCF|nr:hypothetical protein PILCRDRAFT_819452 [Piloderma croceum F 1598]
MYHPEEGSQALRVQVVPNSQIIQISSSTAPASFKLPEGIRFCVAIRWSRRPSYHIEI